MSSKRIAGCREIAILILLESHNVALKNIQMVRPMFLAHLRYKLEMIQVKYTWLHLGSGLVIFRKEIYCTSHLGRYRMCFFQKLLEVLILPKKLLSAIKNEKKSSNILFMYFQSPIQAALDQTLKQLKMESQSKFGLLKLLICFTIQG